MNVDRSCRSIESSSNGNPLVSLRWLLPTSRFISVHVVLATVAMATMSAVCSADTHDGSGESYATAIQDRARLAAEVEVLKAEQTVLLSEDRSAGPALLQDLTRMDSVQLRERLTGLLDANFTSVPHALTGAVGSAASITEELSRDLAQARTRLVADRKLLLEVRAQRQFTGQLASLFNVDNKWLWLGGVVAFGTLLGLIMHDRRHSLRRMLWVRRARAVALVALGMAIFAIPVLPTVLTFALGDQTYETLLALTTSRTADELGEDPAEQLKLVQAEITTLEETRRGLIGERQKLIAKRQQRLAEVFGDRVTLAADWTTLRDDVMKSHVALIVPQAMSVALTSDLQRVQKLDEKLKQEQQGVESYSRMKRLTGAAVGLGLLGFVLLCGLAFQRSINSRRKTVSATCPRCLAVGKLVIEPAPAGTPAALRSDLSELRCTNVFDEASNDECGFSFRSQYRDRIKVSFPTLGVASSGKTHWLAMVYQQLNQGKAPDGVHFERIQSSGSTRFDRFVTDILQARTGMSATQLDLPEPLIFGFRDRDQFSLGGTDVLVNMFDFAGTISVSRDLRDAIRVRQLNSEGFLFFLDPSKESDTQVDALLKFREEVKLVKRLGTGRQLHTPVALCVTKLDTTVYQDYARGGDVMTSFFEELSRIDTRTKPMSLTRIRKRSDLVAELRDTVWQNWEIENQIRGLFGDRFMFFPMTPVGLPPEGVTDERIINDLKQRTIEPYGILEPLLWLLHMNGYPVLKP